MPRAAKKKIIRAETHWSEAIRELRLDRNLTQQNVADYLGISQRAYSDYELGTRRISVEQLLKLSQYYGVSMDDLCEGPEKVIGKGGHFFENF